MRGKINSLLNAGIAQLVVQLICQSNSVKNTMDSKKKGNLTELQCLAAFIECGCGVSIPYGDNSKYDFIADKDGQLLRIQVKTSSIKNGNPDAICFSCRSTHVNCSGVKNVRYNENEIDYFATYWNGKCYVIPVQECSVEKTLRFAPPKNGQIKGITFAEKYEISKILGGSN